MIVRARWLVTMASAPVGNGAVAIAGSRIADAGPWSDVRRRNSGRVLDLGECVLLPGLINAHCHLDYTMLRGTIPRPSSFTAWVRAINQRKASLRDADYVAAIDAGIREATRFGTTSMINFEAFPHLLSQSKRPPLRVWWLVEMIDLRARVSAETLYAQVRGRFEKNGDWLGGVGLAPHAPYTASRELYAASSVVAAAHPDALVSTHVAESREEMAMFRDRAGSLFDFVHGLGRPSEDCGAITPFGWFRQHAAPDERWVLAHLNELTDADISSVKQGARFHVVHCPRSHAYFGHCAFRYEELRAAGVNVCVGTDSVASNENLSLLAELRQMNKVHPELSPLQLLQTVTTNAAAAVQQSNTLGRVARDSLADLIAIPATAGDVLEQIVAYEGAVPWVMIDGKEVTPAEV